MAISVKPIVHDSADFEVRLKVGIIYFSRNKIIELRDKINRALKENPQHKETP